MKLGLFGKDRDPAPLAVAFAAVLLSVVCSVVLQLQFEQRTPQIRELGGKSVETVAQLGDLYLGMDRMAFESHVARLWTVNGIIFAGAAIVIAGMRSSRR